MKEIWKDIPNQKDYKISSLGNLKSLKWNKERVLNPEIDKNGYYRCLLSNSGKTKHHLIHRLVLIAFFVKTMYFNVIRVFPLFLYAIKFYSF